MLVRPRRTAVPHRRGPLVAAAALSTLVVSAALLLSGAYLRPAPPTGACPAATSIAVRAGGQRLLMRWEPTGAGSALLHLCADRAIGPVRSWSVSAGAVARTTDRTALAIVPRDPDAPLAVTVVPAAGPPLTFGAAPSGTAGTRR